MQQLFRVRIIAANQEDIDLWSKIDLKNEDNKDICDECNEWETPLKMDWNENVDFKNPELDPPFYIRVLYDCPKGVQKVPENAPSLCRMVEKYIPRLNIVVLNHYIPLN